MQLKETALWEPSIITPKAQAKNLSTLLFRQPAGIVKPLEESSTPC